MSWLKGDRATIEPRIKSYPGIWNNLRKSVKATRIVLKGYRVELRYKKHREAFESLRDDMQALQGIDTEMVKFYLRQPWGIPI